MSLESDGEESLKRDTRSFGDKIIGFVFEYPKTSLLVLFPFLCGLSWLMTSGNEATMLEQARLHRLAIDTEKAQCLQAGYIDAHWDVEIRPSEADTRRFFCVNAHGQLFPFMPPLCNTEGHTEDVFHTHECEKLPKPTNAHDK